jgi:cytidylate kinase
MDEQGILSGFYRSGGKQIMAYPNRIAIDGPAASGKSSVGMGVAQYFGYLFLDTGIMYRAVTWAIIDQFINVDNEQMVSDLVQKITIEIKAPSVLDGRINDIYVDGEDITWKIKDPKINLLVSIVSAYPKVREVLTASQKIIGSKGKIVMAGRDIGTVVMPNADLKIFLKASAEERAKRRFDEEIKRGEIDSSRILAPLIPAADAIIINTDKKTKDEVIHEIISIAIGKRNEKK